MLVGSECLNYFDVGSGARDDCENADEVCKSEKMTVTLGSTVIVMTKIMNENFN